MRGTKLTLENERKKRINKIDSLPGKKIGRLLVIKRVENNEHGNARVLCSCDCGNYHIAYASDLYREFTTSCGCYHKELVTLKNKTHGKYHTREYRIWSAMRSRCENKKTPCYSKYGGRGIKVCARWEKFENFIADMGKCPSDKHSIDRINNNGDYTPSNCRWATRIEQANNTSRNRFVEFNGQRNTVTQWSRILGISRHNVHKRIKAKLPVDKILSVPA